MITIKNTQRTIRLSTTRLERHAQKMLDSLGYSDFDLGIWLTTDATIRKYNRQYRGKDKPTDILSFPYHPKLKPGERILPREEEDKNLGDLIISLAYVKKDAPRWGQSFTERLDVLLAHGIAHLLGHDHEKDEDYRIMHKLEKRLLNSLK